MNKKLLISLGTLSVVTTSLPILATISCSSEEAPKGDLINLNIIPKISGQKITEQQVIYLKGKDPKTQLPVLQKLFDGIITENQNKFTFVVSNTNVVTLTAIKDYIFINGKPTIASPAFTIEKPPTPPADVNLAITANSSNIELTGLEIVDLEGADANKQLVILNKLFTGINATNKNNFTIIFSTNNNVFLIAKPGFTFSGKETLNKNYSLKITAINITVRQAFPNITIKEADVLKEETSASNAAKQAEILSRGFVGIDTTNINYLNIEWVSYATQVILTTKPGFVFGTDPNSKVTRITTVYNLIKQNIY
ncbi:MAG: hypothetical protein ACRDAW_01980 [Metamycoplasmataceae bacterium]